MTAYACPMDRRSGRRATDLQAIAQRETAWDALWLAVVAATITLVLTSWLTLPPDPAILGAPASDPAPETATILMARAQAAPDTSP